MAAIRERAVLRSRPRLAYGRDMRSSQSRRDRSNERNRRGESGRDRADSKRRRCGRCYPVRQFLQYPALRAAMAPHRSVLVRAAAADKVFREVSALRRMQTSRWRSHRAPRLRYSFVPPACCTSTRKGRISSQSSSSRANERAWRGPPTMLTSSVSFNEPCV